MKGGLIGSSGLVVGAVLFAALAIVRPGEIGSVRVGVGLVGPVRVGVDECAACGMKIEVSGFAGARIVMRDGVRTTLFYDDLGCMLDAAREKDAPVAKQTFVQDATAGAGAGWIRAEAAWYVMDPKNRTPMGSGILAFRDRPGGMSFREVAEKRRAYMKAKYGGD